MDISRHISSLLFDHECVIVPGLGGFVSNYTPARIHPVQHLFQPPYKTILFNPELKNNDGLLANFIAKNEKISFSDALAITSEFSRNTLSDINSGKRIKLEQIGVLYAGNEGRLLFDQDEKVNYLKASYGLSSFISPMISRKYRKVYKKPETKYINRHEPGNTKNRKQAVVWALALIPLFLIFGWILIETQMWKDLSRSETSFVPAISEQIADSGPTENEESNIENPELTEIKSIPIKTEEASFIPDLNNTETPKEVAPEPEVKVEIKVETPHQPPPQNIQQKMYYIIGGSFKSIENAESLILSYQERGYDKSCVIGQAANGFHRVSISAYLRKNDAITELNIVRENLNPDAWVLRK